MGLNSKFKFNQSNPNYNKYIIQIGLAFYSKPIHTKLWTTLFCIDIFSSDVGALLILKVMFIWDIDEENQVFQSYFLKFTKLTKQWQYYQLIFLSSYLTNCKEDLAVESLALLHLQVVLIWEFCIAFFPTDVGLRLLHC